ncbi:hypothetical protein [Longimicrobium terrae]|uniref:Uncharacterized protein n=1 Tax=Longimicrobium terrae TaxID=1639882 RepID=A0A841GR45_9BACT|nr:hypothetical protein [Longimicrobium terrae]MBB4635648.1 hypothetical protein [Longimicrobium terrae]MBB6070042.1 hypothetical protein [Longimicrobium terrae]NNC32948.1 hypothetical protein [Longimicrobium terrae]
MSGTGPGSRAGVSAGGSLSYPTAKILLYLAELAARDGGYRLLGVRGWVDPSEIERQTRIWGAAELMRLQARRGRVLAHDARPPGEGRPLWLYRIAQVGVDSLAESVNVWPAGVGDPIPGGDPCVFLREGPLRAWEALVLASKLGGSAVGEWVPGEPEWRTARELNGLLTDEDAAPGAWTRCFWSEDLRWLVSHAFAEQQIVDRTHVYRLTCVGAALRPLEWRDARR